MLSKPENLKRLVAARLSEYARRDPDLARALVPGLQSQSAGTALDKRARMDLLEQSLREAVTEVIAAEGQADRADPNQIVIEMLDDIVGLGPLEALLRDENVEDIYVFGHDRVLVKPPRSNRIRPVPLRFRSEEHLRNLVYRILAQVNRRLDESSPVVDTRLPGTDDRINITIPPVSAGPWYITIRKHQEAWDWIKLIEEGTADFRTLALLALAVRGGLNVLVSGGTGAGKTTLLNVLARFIPPDERVVTIEDTEELQLEAEEGGEELPAHLPRGSEMDFDLRRRRNVASLLTRPAAPGQPSPFTLRDLVIVSLRLSPKRIIVGEVRGNEAFDMLQALNTGHDGSICTIHASTAEQAVGRLRGMLRMGGLSAAGDEELDEYVGRALHLVVHLRQMPDGARRISEVAWLRLVPVESGGSRLVTIPLVRGAASVSEEAAGETAFTLEQSGGMATLLRFLEAADTSERLGRNRRATPGSMTAGRDSDAQFDEVELLAALAARISDEEITLEELRQLITVLNNDAPGEEGEAGPETVGGLSRDALRRREAAEGRLVKWLDETEPPAAPTPSSTRARRRVTGGTLAMLSALREDHLRPLQGGAFLRSDLGHEFLVPTAGVVTIGRFNRETGRAPDIDLEFIDPRLSVSREHARLTAAEDAFWLEDLGSHHGTRVNGERVLPGQKRLLNDHDVIALGIVRLTFVALGSEQGFSSTIHGAT